MLAIYADMSCCFLTEGQSHLTCVRGRFNHYNVPQLASPSPLLSHPVTLDYYLTPFGLSLPLIIPSPSCLISAPRLPFCLLARCLTDVAVQLPDKKSIIMYVTSLFAVLPKDVSMESIREVETLPRKYKVEAEASVPGPSAKVKIIFHVQYKRVQYMDPREKWIGRQDLVQKVELSTQKVLTVCLHLFFKGVPLCANFKNPTDVPR